MYGLQPTEVNEHPGAITQADVEIPAAQAGVLAADALIEELEVSLEDARRRLRIDEALVLAHQDVIELLLDEQATSLAVLGEQTGKSIRLQTESLYPQDQFDVVLM